jgi:hypothetical protein
MGIFELVFSLEVKRKRGSEWFLGDSGIVERVIIINDRNTAEKIGLAMIGEEIFPRLYIKELLRVDPTDKTPFLNSLSDKYTWNRVLSIFGLERSDVGFVFHTRYIPPAEIISAGKRINRKERRVLEVVGLKLSPNQRDYVLSLIL